MPQKKKAGIKMKKVAYHTLYFITVVSVVLVLVFGAVLFFFVPEKYDTALGISSIVIAVLQIAAYIINLSATSMFLKKLNNINVRNMRETLNAKSEALHSNYQGERKRIIRLRNIIIAYVVFMLLLSAYQIISITKAAVIPLNLIPSLYIILNIAVGFIKPVDDSKGKYISRQKYPTLYSVTDRAKDALGVKEDVRICLVSSNSVGIAKIQGFISVAIDPILLSLMREEELYSVLIHEMAHIKNEDSEAFACKELADLIMPPRGRIFNYFSYPAVLFSYESILCKELSSVIAEEKADRAIAEHADIQAAADMFFKIECYILFHDKLDRFMGENFYAPEKCRTDVAKRTSDKFIEVAPEYEKLWHSLVMKEIQAKNASHPIARSRIEKLGVSDFKLTLPLSEGDFHSECEKALKNRDKEFFAMYNTSYDEDRKKYYLQPLSVIEEWEKAGKPCRPEDARDILDALTDIFMYDEALRFATEIIDTQEGGLVVNAHFVRGMLRLEQYDDEGIDDIYYAVEQNGNYVEQGLNAIGGYCCQMGLEDKLAEYRERAIGYMQKNIDNRGVHDITASDELSEETLLPDDIKARNLEFIVSTCGDILEGVWLVHKYVNENYSVSAYVIKFKENTEEPSLCEDAIDRIFKYLDSTPEDWEYALYSYNGKLERAFAKVPNCRIFKATDGK